MLAKLRILSLGLFLAVLPARAEDVPEAHPNPNHLYFEPVLTLVSLLEDDLPVIVAVTYERDLPSDNAFVWHPQVFFGDAKVDDVTVTQYTTAQYAGLRHYFGPAYQGFYLQASVLGGIGNFEAREAGEPDKASGTISEYGALGYAGYKWPNVFVDVGYGYQGAGGTLKFDSGTEADVSNSGPVLEIGTGIGF